MRCPFCADELDDNVLVCRSCSRDAAIPAHLRNEHDGLLRKRDALRADLERTRAELERYRKQRFSRSRSGS